MQVHATNFGSIQLAAVRLHNFDARQSCKNIKDCNHKRKFVLFCNKVDLFIFFSNIFAAFSSCFGFGCLETHCTCDELDSMWCGLTNLTNDKLFACYSHFLVRIFDAFIDNLRRMIFSLLFLALSFETEYGFNALGNGWRLNEKLM